MDDRKWNVHTFPDYGYKPPGTLVRTCDTYIEASDLADTIDGSVAVTAADPVRLTCIDDRVEYGNRNPDQYVTGVVHSWENRGLDIVRGVLRQVTVCVWCDRQKTKAPK